MRLRFLAGFWDERPHSIFIIRPELAGIAGLAKEYAQHDGLPRSTAWKARKFQGGIDITCFRERTTTALGDIWKNIGVTARLILPFVGILHETAAEFEN
jgi:hypothetical protein